MDIICFDLDNTLIYSDKSHVIGFNRGLIKAGLKRKKEEEMVKWFGLPKIEVVKKLAPDHPDKWNEIIKEHDNILINESYKYAKPIGGVIETLKELKKRYKIAVLSNCRHQDILKLLRGAGIEEYLFDLIVGYDDVEHSKPEPDEIFKAEKLLKHKVKYVVGDTIYDIRAGKKAGIKTIAVLTGWHSKNRLKKERPDFIINNFKELIKILK